MTTTRRATIIAPTRREVLMSLGRPGNRNWSGGRSIGSPLRLANLVGRRRWWPRVLSPRLRKSTDETCQTTDPRPARYFASRSISTVESAQFMARFVMTILRSPVMISAKASMTTPCANR